MYGTIARMRVKAGKEAEFERTMTGARDTPGFVFAHVYRMDSDPQELMLVVAFDGRESYRKNAESSEQHQEYLAYRELLDAEPEWHDGEIIFTEAQTGATATS